jgi:hypothetical protein
VANFYYLTERMKLEIERIIRKVDGFRGPGIKNDRDSLSLGLSPQDTRGRAAVQPCVKFKILTAASGGGKYNIVIGTPSAAAVSASGTLSEANLGTFGTAANALGLNSAETGKSTHDLTTGTPVAKVFVGYLEPRLSAEGKLVVVFNGIDWESCT